VGYILIAFPNLVLAQSEKPSPTGESISNAIDCTEVEVNYQDSSSLTRDERVQLMDKAFYTSLGKYDACLNSKSGNGGGGAASNSNMAGGGDGSGGMSGTDGKGETSESLDSTGGESIANTSMSGTEKPIATASSSDGDAESTASSGEATQTGLEENISTFDNGKLPEDIPSADNDSVLEAQIRQAAINEKNPVTKAKLWNEYRKYKGLPEAK